MKNPVLFLTLGLAVGALPLSAQPAPAAVTPEQATLTIRADKAGPVINRNIYGHFAEHLGHCIYGGFWVGPDSSIPNTRGIRNDVVAALKNLNIPVLRWPGGCFADEYHWKDGIGPREKRPKMINTHWGGVVEDNAFGTHEFFDLCEQLGAEPYVCGNVGSGTPQEMMEWVEYMTSDADSPMANLRRANGRAEPWKLPYFGVGNENWGCGGNMRPEFYADNYLRYSTFVKNYPPQKVYRIAGGANVDDYRWTDVLMANAGKRMNGLSLHYYTIPSGVWGKWGPATGFAEDQWHATLRQAVRMDELITKHSAIMDKYDPEKKVGLVVDEWGTWTDPTPGTNPGFLEQQNTLRDALVAAIHFQVFHKHADRVVMANLAQTVNVLQAVILTDKEKMVLTPTYHVFEMFKVHQGETAIPLELETPSYTFESATLPMVGASASRAATGGPIHVSLVNTNPHFPATVTCQVAGVTPGRATGRVLTATAMDSHNTFTAPNAVTPRTFTDAKIDAGKLTVTLPAKSVVVLTLQ